MLGIKLFSKLCHALSEPKAKKTKRETASDTYEGGRGLHFGHRPRSYHVCPLKPRSAHPPEGFRSPNWADISHFTPCSCFLEQAGIINRCYRKPHPLLWILDSRPDPAAQEEILRGQCSSWQHQRDFCN